MQLPPMPQARPGTAATPPQLVDPPDPNVLTDAEEAAVREAAMPEDAWRSMLVNSGQMVYPTLKESVDYRLAHGGQAMPIDWPRKLEPRDLDPRLRAVCEARAVDARLAAEAAARKWRRS